MDLIDWQNRLELHFSKLAAFRREKALPVFALEHGLDQTDLRQVTAMLHAQLRRNANLADNWLLWVIYAAEQGYNYDGAEYWTSFERRTPNWTLRADRRQLRSWFKKFHTKYNGLQPTGEWAGWFSIIAWPITHAVLPKDLQYQLAKSLYVLRYQLSSRINDQPAAIARFLARCTPDGSSRFQNFLEQEEVAGRIILELLGNRVTEIEGSIHPTTLSRIVSDLEGARNAREWLRDARRVVDAVQFKGTSGAPLGAKVELSHPSALLDKLRALEVRPTITLRRSDVDSWQPVLGLPSLRDLGDLVPDLDVFLRKTRCSIAGSTGMLPAGWLLAGAQRRVLSTWPDATKSLIKFEKPHPTLEYLLQSEARIAPGPIWLFRIGLDGLAYEVRGKQVRAGQNYILMSQTALPATSLATAAVIKCEGVTGVHLSVPKSLLATQISELRLLGLGVAKVIKIWPAGLAARTWDGEGHSEWLQGESPCFGLEYDHPINGLEICLDNAVKMSMAGGPPGSVKFIALPPLLPGTHSLSVRAIPANYSGGDIDGGAIDGFISLNVRPPHPWSSGTSGHAGLIVTVDPEDLSLDQVWEGQSRVHVFGPAEQRVDISLDFLGSSGEILGSEPIANLALPVTSEIWDRAFSSFLKKELSPRAYLAASSGRLTVSSELLGKFTIPLHRNVRPVRWAWQKDNRATTLQLIDDQEGDSNLSTTFYSFARPALEIQIDTGTLRNGFSPEATGGLCVALYGEQRECLIASMSQVDGGFTGLITDPVIDDPSQDRGSVQRLLKIINLWSTAKLVGPLAAIRRDRVVEALKQQIFRILCGHDWAEAEMKYFKSNKRDLDLERLIEHVGRKRAFALVIRRDAELFSMLSPAERITRLSQLATRYEIAGDKECDSAIELCEAVDQGSIPDEQSLERYYIDLRTNPTLVRGVRLMMLARNQPSSVGRTEATLA